MLSLLSKLKDWISSRKKIIDIIFISSAFVIILSAYLYDKYTAPWSFLSSLNAKQQRELGLIIGDVYQNLYGYKTICKTENIVMEKYPEAYKKQMSKNLNLLNEILAKDELTVESALPLFLSYEEIQIFNNHLYQKFRTISDSEENGIKSACLMFEEQAETIVSALYQSFGNKHHKTLSDILK